MHVTLNLIPYIHVGVPNGTEQYIAERGKISTKVKEHSTETCMYSVQNSFVMDNFR